MAQERTSMVARNTKGTPDADECRALGELLAMVGDKWTVMTVAHLSSGPKRFNELRRLIGVISQRMLTLTLRRLEEEGLVTRTVFATVPSRVDYELTPHGMTLIAPLQSLAAWAATHRRMRTKTAR
ncbi:winged helix-turn-helix transcriptional regulator [Xanthomonas hortorum]|uniref:Helix-turn-helix transcriptional regulator n=1 Tax=Xanthomonas hortorum TaxID=56454 RepID=A0AA47ETM5_9XANT|nr:helix-turn-helix domain-containing protein [Xanthomonas hortorum]WAH65031.1 helix-turn-helix transcriptional regulator [Xanthomonas hortorum]